ncbi:MAG: hypothetical protein K8T25_15710 [Planctomycetia bacterium]|nr:hypothetical protein [Planctomycetia bacterium]
MPQAHDIEGTVFHSGSATLLARVVGAGGQPIAAAGVSTVHYSVEQLDDRNDQAATAVAGHHDVALTPADVLLSPLQTDARWTIDDQGYNFRHELDVSEDDAFPTAGRRYRVTYRLLPTSGQVIVVRFNLLAI